MKVRLYGASDDLVLIDFDGSVVEELDAYEKPVRAVYHDKNGVLGLCIEHTKRGWENSIFLPEDHDDGQPALPVKMYLSENGYSMVAEVEVEPTCEILFYVGDAHVRTYAREKLKIVVT